MTPDENRCLGSIEQKLDDLLTHFVEFKKTAISEQGFTRCAVHKEKMANVVKQVSWLKRIITICIIVPVLAGVGLKIHSHFNGEKDDTKTVLNLKKGVQ